MEAYSQPAPPQQEKLKCPRCDSMNTKFCYYNNYNLSQPRHFCKGCRRYWTKGGALRNIPVGGSSKKAAAKRGKRPASTEERSENEAVFSLDGECFGQGQFGNFAGFGGNDEGYFGELGSLAGMGGGFGSSSGAQFDGFGSGNYYYGDLSLGQNVYSQPDVFFNIGDNDGEGNGGWPDLEM